MSVQYIYYRYHQRYETTVNSLPEALARAKSDVEYQMAAPDSIVCEDGTILDEDDILERSGYYSDVEIDGIVIESTLVPAQRTLLPPT